MTKQTHNRTSSLYVRILCTVVLGIFGVSAAVTAIIINISTHIFVDTYGESQEKAFLQIEKDLNGFYEDMMKITAHLGESWAVKMYLSDNHFRPEREYNIAYQTARDMESAAKSQNGGCGILVLGMSGKSVLSNNDSITTPVADILAGDATKNALAHPRGILFQRVEQGYTTSTRNGAMILGTRVLTGADGKIPYAIIYLLLKEEEFAGFYDYFTGETNQIAVLDDEGEIVTSSRPAEEIRKQELFAQARKMEEGRILRQQVRSDRNSYTVLTGQLPYYQFHLCAVIDSNRAIRELYHLPQIALICMAISSAVLAVIFVLIRQMLKPLNLLAGKMSGVREGRFDQHVEITGPEEIRELSATFNYMMDDLNRYVDQLVKSQSEKREAEIHALQMQINPHYMYNTLASIKWLIFQGEQDKAARTIDAFISLLRNTISNTDEFITVARETENLKNYVLINNVRYGEDIQVEFYIAPGCEKDLIPKLILQPFIENAFFHAFPEGRRGEIQLFARKQDGRLLFEITDNGVGMTADQVRALTSGEGRKQEHFTGIGIRNVDDRIKMIYGMDYGIRIESGEGRGTTIIICLPVRQEQT